MLLIQLQEKSSMWILWNDLLNYKACCTVYITATSPELLTTVPESPTVIEQLPNWSSRFPQYLWGIVWLMAEYWGSQIPAYPCVLCYLFVWFKECYSAWWGCAPIPVSLWFTLSGGCVHRSPSHCDLLLFKPKRLHKLSNLADSLIEISYWYQPFSCPVKCSKSRAFDPCSS